MQNESPSTHKLFDYTLVSKLPEIKFKSKTVINTINPCSYCLAESDSDFKNALLNADFFNSRWCRNGMGYQIIKWEKLNKIADFELFSHSLKHLKSIKESFYL